jgi:gamma-glutamyltranspeptidase/glutathione hydrolase
VTTPGSVASWSEAHAAYGRVPLARCLESAIGYARDGYPVTARLAGWIASCARELAPHAASAALFLPGERRHASERCCATRAWRERWRPCAAEGAAGFYAGEVGATLVRFAAAEGGFFDADDLNAQDARWGEPLVGSYRGVTLYETPAPTQGFTVLEMLNLLQPFALHKMPFLAADPVHLMIQAKQLAVSRSRPLPGRPALRRRADRAARLQGARRRAAAR